MGKLAGATHALLAIRAGKVDGICHIANSKTYRETAIEWALDPGVTSTLRVPIDIARKSWEAPEAQVRAWLAGSAAKQMIAGGATDQVRTIGGEDLFITLTTSMAGKRLDACVYALTRCMSNLGLLLDSADDASALFGRMAADAGNELALNWDNRQRLLAEARAQYHADGGHG